MVAFCRNPLLESAPYPFPLFVLELGEGGLTQSHGVRRLRPAFLITISMKIRIVWWASLMAALLVAATAKAQPIVDCTCLTTQAQSLLITNACQGIVPDLCQFTNCYRSTVVPLPPLFCSQSPISGTVLGPGNHPITVTVMDASGQ